MPLATLENALQQAFTVVEQHVPALSSPLELTNGYYPELATVPFGGPTPELAARGLYVVTDSGPSQRVLYVGSSVQGQIRKRLVAHLFGHAGPSRAGVAYESALESWARYGCPPAEEVEETLRCALWDGNRWSTNADAWQGWRCVAIQLVSDGAFEVAMVRVPERFGAVARCLERFAAQRVRAVTGAWPPLNDCAVTLDESARRSAIEDCYIESLYAALDKVA